MGQAEKRKARTLLGEFSSRVGIETLNVRIYRERDSCVCEREVVERDGTSFVMVFPFGEVAVLRDLLTADPYYRRVRAEVGKLIGRIDRALHSSNAEANV